MGTAAHSSVPVQSVPRKPHTCSVSSCQLSLTLGDSCVCGETVVRICAEQETVRMGPTGRQILLVFIFAVSVSYSEVLAAAAENTHSSSFEVNSGASSSSSTSTKKTTQAVIDKPD